MRQILKSTEHNQKVLVNFIGLKQAFDSIWHDGMWIVMQNEGMPEQVIKSNVLQKHIKNATLLNKSIDCSKLELSGAGIK